MLTTPAANRVLFSEYIESTKEPFKKQTLVRLHAFVQLALQWTKHSNGLSEEIPDVFVSSENEIDAVEIFGAISISQGLISHILGMPGAPLSEVARHAQSTQGENIFPEATLDLVDHVTPPQLVSAICLAWVICHEYTHIYRKHKAVEETTGSEPSVSHAFEFDADCCAAAGVYRATQIIYRTTIPDLTIRRLVFHSLYWLIRELPNPPTNRSHLPWINRAFHLYAKMGTIRTNPTDAPDSDIAFPETRHHVDILCSFMCACEMQYIRMNPGAEKGWIVKMKDAVTQDRAIENWSNIKNLVAEKSGTYAGQSPEGEADPGTK